MKHVKHIITLLAVFWAVWFLHGRYRLKEASEANNAAIVKLDSQQFEEALVLLNRASELGASDAELMAIVAHHRSIAYSGLGLDYFRENSFKKALPLFQKAVKASRRVARDHNTWFYIGECYRQISPKNIENTRKAIDAYGRALKDNPDNDDAQLGLETVRARLEALPLREKALSAFRSGKFDEAEPIFRKFIEKPALLREINDVHPRYSLAVIKFENHEPGEALQLLLEAEERSEGGKPVRKKIQELRVKIVEKYPELKGKERKRAFDSLFD